jgi:hypothetical protein
MKDIEALLGTTAPSTNQLSDIEEVCQQALALKNHIDMLDEAKKKTNEELHALLSKTLPDMISGAGITEFKMNNGTKVELKEYVSGSLPKEDEARSAAFEYIREHSGESLIKMNVVAKFERGDTNRAASALAALRELEVDFDAKEDIHPMTLAAWARERMKNGEEVALETIGLTAGRMAKIVTKEKKV